MHEFVYQLVCLGEEETRMTRGQLSNPFLIMFQFLMAYLAMVSTTSTTDQSALLAFKSGLSIGSSHLISRNWSSSSSVCQWTGVTCDLRHQRVTQLDLSGMGLSGTLPPELGNLTFLVNLNLSMNNFQGTLPQEWEQLRRLEIMDLKLNNLIGGIPSWVWFLKELQYLSLRNNTFTHFLPYYSTANISKLRRLDVMFNSIEGSIPEQVGNAHNLTYINLQYNKISGPIPPSIFNLSNLNTLALTSNSLTGTLPADICSGLPNLQQLYVSINNLQGEIPSNISGCSQLTLLSLSVNNFSGHIPQEIGSLKLLEEIYLDANQFTGKIPREIGNLTILQLFRIGTNKMTGTIPEEFGSLSRMQHFQVDSNSLWGSIPTGMFNISTLQFLSLSRNGFIGILPDSLGYGLPNLEEIYLADNYFTGEIPPSISNSSKLIKVEFGGNSFSGIVPDSLGDLNFLEYLNLARNNLSTKSSDLHFITSLAKCKYLRLLNLYSNPFYATIPSSMGNLSNSLGIIDISNCFIYGSIPSEVGNLTSLSTLYISSNNVIGSIPSSVGNLKGLEGLYLYHNNISGSIPEDVCMMENINAISIDENQISGHIPSCVGNLTTLSYIYMGFNRLDSFLPRSLWQLPRLLVLNLTTNLLVGSLTPDIENLKAATTLDLSWNRFSGDIPISIGGMDRLIQLSLAHNHMEGSIPDSISKMLDLQYLDLSYNNLSSSIPENLQSLLHLNYFNVSFNNLSGKIPSGGPFRNFSKLSFLGNKGLCGVPEFGLLPCGSSRVEKTQKTKVIILIVLVGLATLALSIGLVLAYRFRNHRKEILPNELPALNMGVVRISYYDLLQATQSFSDNNLLGSGAFGYVYKGVFSNGEIVAVKVFNSHKENAFKSFETECEVLRSLRHRNLCKVISSCSNKEFKALVMEYKSNGSLEKWLYSDGFFLDTKQRLSIMIDVACALDYLHCGTQTPIVHRDLKPSNILLDEDMVGYLTDFGISKLLKDEDSFVYTKTIATLGYMAPEYGSDGLVSIKCDIYSYGILLMEMFTSTKPSDEALSEGLSLRSWIIDSLPKGIAQIVDKRLLQLNQEKSNEILECFSIIFDLAIKCSMEMPDKRISMEEVVATLKKILRKL